MPASGVTGLGELLAAVAIGMAEEDVVGSEHVDSPESAQRECHRSFDGFAAVNQRETRYTETWPIRRKEAHACGHNIQIS